MEAARPLSYRAGAASLWVRFRVGTFMPHIPPTTILNRELELPRHGRDKFWLHGRTWDIPNFDNADTFVEHLVRGGVLTCDPLVDAALHGELTRVPARTIRHHFQHSTGLRQNVIQQIARVQRAVALLQQGHPPLATAQALGYADQSHLTRSVKRFLGSTPHEIHVSSPSTK